MAKVTIASLVLEPRSEKCKKAFYIIESAHQSVKDIFTVFESLRRTKGKKGTTTDQEQDLLRAMLVFASSGLDSMIKQLIRDTLDEVHERNSATQKGFEDFSAKFLRLKTGESTNHVDIKTLSKLLTHRNPRMALLQELQKDLTANSLQSSDQILKVAAAFTIGTSNLNTTPEKLKNIFSARNMIIHEMDIDFSKPNRSRRQRTKGSTVKMTNDIFSVAFEFLKKVDELLLTGEGTVAST